MSELQIEEKLSPALSRLAGLGALIQFDLGEEGRWQVDARSRQPVLSRGEGDADCSISTSAETLFKLLDGRLDPMLAYAMGKLKVKAGMGVAMKLVQAIG